MAGIFEFNIGHTPGIYYAFAYFLSSLLYLSTLGTAKIGKKTLLITPLYFAVLEVFMYLTEGVEDIVFVLCILVVFAFIFIYFLLCGNTSCRKALYFTMRSFILGEFTAALQWHMYYFAVTTLGMEMNTLTSLLFVAVIYAVVLIPSFLLERRYRSFNANFTLTNVSLTVTLLAGVAVFVFSNLSFLSWETPFSSTNELEIFAVRTLADFSGCLILFSLHTQTYEIYSRIERENLDTLLKMQEDSYRISAESIEVVNRKYHDLKHQIALLKSDLPHAEKMVFLAEMEHEICSYEARNKTGNETLDILLSAKTLQCQKRHITLTCIADGKELNFISPSDISVLFGNALDNAIECVEKIADESKRLIHFSVTGEKSFLRIHVENCCEDKLEFRDGLPLTTKGSDLFHGFGVKSIRAITEKYGGSMLTQLTNGWFELRVLIPIPKEPTAYAPKQ